MSLRSRRSRLAPFAVVLSAGTALGALTGCGGKVAGDDLPGDEAGLPSDPPVALADFDRCDERLPPAWTRACDGSPAEHGQLCATPSYLTRCSALSGACTGKTVEEILAVCDPGFYHRPGARFAVDFDTTGCAASLEWAGVPAAVAQCVADRVITSRYPCVGSVDLYVPCSTR